MELVVSSVNKALELACAVIRRPSDWLASAPRGIPVMEYAEPVTTIYTRPWQRVLFCPERDANPFFHLFESLWMLGGRDDAAFLDQFTTNFSRFAEPDGHLHGAYGHRWRWHFGMDQLRDVIDLLHREPDTRRAVIAMWDPSFDLHAKANDIPCNTNVYFRIRGGKLHMSVVCRSNDIILGCYGANAVHFSVLMEYVAAHLKLPMGRYTHFSHNWHYYLDNPFIQLMKTGAAIDHGSDYYAIGAGPQMQPLAVVNIATTHWDADLRTFLSDDWHDPTNYSDVFFIGVATTMRDAWSNYKRGDLETALYLAKQIKSPDWRSACVGWLNRRINRRNSK